MAYLKEYFKSAASEDYEFVSPTISRYLNVTFLALIKTIAKIEN
jgi:hypothetical protein